jgi:S1-C subfamily serine protease
MTAAHCLSASVTVEGHIAWAVFVNEDADLAVLMVPGISLPALQPRVQDIEVGMPVATFGYGHGWPVPQMRIAHVAVVGALMEFLPDTQRVLVVDNVLVGGMSGGPMVDEDGRVVSVNQLTDSGSGSGMGRVMPLVMEITRQFWEFDR